MTAAMKALSLAAALLPALVLLSACDRHSWEPTENDPGTKMLYEHHGDGHGGGHGDGHGAGHHKEDGKGHSAGHSVEDAH